MEKLKKLRTVARRYFTKAADGVAEAGLPQEIKGLLKYFEEKAEALFTLDEQIKEEFLKKEDFDVESFEKDQDSTEEYRKRYHELKTLYEETMLEDNLCKSRSEVTVRSEKKVDFNRKFKLPAIEFRKFDGQISGWLGFWGQFHKIDEDPNIDDNDKLQYLIQATEEGSTARRVVESFPPSGKNYKKALEQIKNRFGKESLLIELYVRELLKLVLKKEKENLSVLYDKLTAQIRSLETLNVTTDKYAAMLYPLVESALPSEVLQTWIRFQSTDWENDEESYNLNSLLKFLKREVESFERLELVKAGIEQYQESRQEIPPTAACIVAGQAKDSVVCVWCDKPSHSSSECHTASRMKVEDKNEIIKKKGLCFYCLRKGHSAKKCRVFVRCLICSRRHMTIMCKEIKEGTEKKQKVMGKENKENESASNTLLSHKDCVTLLPTVKVVVQNGGTMLRVRALIDSGAQRSYIKEELARKLSLEAVETETLGHYVFGGSQTKQKSHNFYNVNVKNIEKSLCLPMEVLGTEEICGPIPLVSNRKLLQKISQYNIKLSDIIDEEKDIQMLIGADNSGILTGGEIIQLENNVTAIKSKFGWFIQGPVSTGNSGNNSLTCNLDITDLWSLETLGIKDPAEIIKHKDQEEKIMKFFNDTITVNNEGRYEVRLLWKEDCDRLWTNRTLAEKRLESTTRRLVKTKNLGEYHETFQNWLESGIIEKVSDDDYKTGHYLAHHAVIKEASTTTRVRPVFNASAEDGRSNSLNKCLYAGVNLLEVIPKKLTPFRMHAYGVTADIRKAFLQISLTPEDRQYLKFLWWEDIEKQDTLTTYRHCRVVFGVACSPFLLNATIAYHLDRAPQELQDTARKLKDSYYVDNCVTSFESKEEVLKFIDESKQLMDGAKMDLRGWTGNFMKSHEKTISILGLIWDIDEDTLSCNGGRYDIEEGGMITKRMLLSYAQKTFDPIGFTSPVTLIPKLLMQRVWIAKIGWDQRVPADVEREFMMWQRNMHLVKTCQVPRRMSSIPLNNANSCIQVHTFCDASKKSYGACVFIRVACRDQVSVQLLAGKSRVAPSGKDICIPRMELIAATICTRLYKQATEGLQVKFESYFWTDSSVVLTWITSQTIWKPFVQNRVNEIRQTTHREDWRHLPGANNPADLLSRGCQAEKLMESRWWEGPDWLKFNAEDWPKSETMLDEVAAVEVERKQRVLCAVDLVEGDMTSKLLKFSSYSKIVRLVAWIHRFYNNCRNKVNKLQGQIKSEEFSEAQDKLFYLIQTEHFRNSKGTIPKLKTVTDKKGLIRVETKLLLSEEENEGFKQPILLPGNNAIVERLVREKHLVMQHAGLHILLAELRNSFWVTRARKIVKRVLESCMKCKRYSAKACKTPLAALPADRVGVAVAFEITGIDLAGPLYLVNGEKCYIVLFTCAVYRALHLELVEALSTEAFMSALRRFIARRGRVKIIYSDNGSNFIGAHNLLKNISWDDIVTSPHFNQIKWYFSPPAAPWWGGFWERMVQMTKALLRRVLGNAKLNYVELLTVLCDIEAAINARPLTYVSESDDLVPLTPNNFIHPLPSNDVCDFDVVDGQSLNSRIKYVQKLRQDLRQRFRADYLALLVHRQKGLQEGRTNNVKVGDICLVESEAKRMNWPLAIVTDVFTGPDGVVRVAKVRTEGGEFLRAVRKLYLLEMSQDEGTQERDRTPPKERESRAAKERESRVSKEDETQEAREKNNGAPPYVTRGGRQIKLPRKFW